MERHFMAVDQYGHTFHGLKNPRKDLCEKLGRKHVGKMYRDRKDGTSRHCGYVIASLWLEIFEVKPINS